MCSVTIRFNVRTLFTFFSFSNVQNANFEEITILPRNIRNFIRYEKRKKKEIQISYPSLSGNSPVSIDDPIDAVRLLIKTRVTVEEKFPLPGNFQSSSPFSIQQFD